LGGCYHIIFTGAYDLVTINAADEFYDPDLDVGKMRARGRFIAHMAPEKVANWIATDAQRMAIWAPVAIGVGVGFYFGFKTEPNWQIGVAVLLGAGLMAGARQRWLRQASLALFLAALGFAAADWRTARVFAPAIERELDIRMVTGRLIAIEDRADAKRILIAVRSIDGIDADRLPARARISWRGGGFEAKPGEMVALRAGLGPPPPPAAPGGFDYARQLYFQRIGAVGFAVSKPAVIEAAPETFRASLAAGVETLRSDLFHRITQAAPGEGGAIVAAIVTGKRDAITPGSKAALRDTGLAHLLAISGLHMGLATGLIFFAVRFSLAAIEPLALKYPIKKWAAGAALLSGVGYLILSGGGWSARRAFIMAAIMFAAILVDRRALSLRNVAIAASIILLTTPEALFHPGFQMSFAAVTALIAGYEWMSRRADPMRSFSLPAKFRRYAVGLALTDTIAALATAPYALYHFHRVALYSLPANILAMPLMGFWIIPAALIALVLAPFGIDGWAWRLSAAGVDTILAIAGEVASWPGAVSLTSQWPMLAMLTLTLGGLVLCLARSPLRLAGLLALPGAALLVANAVAPQIFVAGSGLNAGVVREPGEGGIVVYAQRRDRFSASVWAESVGFDAVKAAPVVMAEIGACDGDGCVVEMPAGTRAAFIESDEALAEDCIRADIVVAFFPVSGRDWRECEAILIDRRSVWRRGAHAVWIGADGEMEIKTVAGMRGNRPWTGSQE
jgi:competence protein ComEC